jgi:hypothetical protein
MHGEMPGFPFPGRPGGEHDEPLLDMIIARRALPPDAPQEMHDLARMLAALAGPAEPGELAREAAVRAAFRQAASPVGVSPAARRPIRHRRSRRSRASRSRVRLAAALVVAAAGLGSVLAAYRDVLPSPFQQLAHVAVAAPAPHHTGSLSSTDASGARHATPRTLQPDSRPGTGSGRSPGAGQSPRRRHSPKAHHPPISPPAPAHGSPGPACNPAPVHWSVPSPTASARPGPAPSWAQPQLCITWPASRSSADQFAP